MGLVSLARLLPTPPAPLWGLRTSSGRPRRPCRGSEHRKARC